MPDRSIELNPETRNIHAPDLTRRTFLRFLGAVGVGAVMSGLGNTSSASAEQPNNEIVNLVLSRMQFSLRDPYLGQFAASKHPEKDPKLLEALARSTTISNTPYFAISATDLEKLVAPDITRFELVLLSRLTDVAGIIDFSKGPFRNDTVQVYDGITVQTPRAGLPGHLLLEALREYCAIPDSFSNEPKLVDTLDFPFKSAIVSGTHPVTGSNSLYELIADGAFRITFSKTSSPSSPVA